MNKGSVSVIIPIYNVEDYLRQCIDSVIRQTYKIIDIILVDDGSTDQSKCICDEYAQKYDNVRVIHKKNGGLSDARNVGLTLADSEYVFFLDSDDYIDTHAIEDLVQFLHLESADIAISEFKRVWNDSEYGRRYKQYEKYEGGNGIVALYNKHIDASIISCAKLYKKKLFDEIKFPVGKRHEDEFTTYKLLYESKKIVYTPSQLYLYRQREGSITKEKDSTSYKDLIDAAEGCIFYFESRDKKLFKMAVTRALFLLKSNCDKWRELCIPEKEQECYTKYCELWDKHKNQTVLPFFYYQVYRKYRINVYSANKIEQYIHKFERACGRLVKREKHDY